MKKLILFIVICIIIISSGFSQSLSLSDPNGPIANNGTIIVQDSANNTILADSIYITNNSNSTINVRVKKEYISIVPGTSNSFCWGNCYTPDIFVSKITVPIGAGATNYSDFIADYIPNGIVGTSIIKYYFYDDADTTDVASVIVEYTGISVGIEELVGKIKFSEAYPNPASSQVTFDYLFPSGVNEANIVIRDILGNTVKESMISNLEGKVVIKTEYLTSGLYFYSLIVNDKIALSKKLIINR